MKCSTIILLLFCVFFSISCHVSAKVEIFLHVIYLYEFFTCSIVHVYDKVKYGIYVCFHMAYNDIYTCHMEK